MASELNYRIDSLADELQDLSAAALKNENSRKRLLGIAMKAVAELEAPIESIWRMIMSVSLQNTQSHLAPMLTFHSQPHAPAALMVLIRMGVVTHLVKAGVPKSAKELANSCGGSDLLIGKSFISLLWI